MQKTTLFGAAAGRIYVIDLEGTTAVLEVRSYDDDLILRHGQPICKMVYERLAGPLPAAYGAGPGNNHYQDQRGPRLSRYFA